MGSDGERGSSPGLVIAHVCSCSWTVVFVPACSSLLMHVCFCLQVVISIHWWSCSFVGSCVPLWVAVPLVRCGGGGPLVGGGGGGWASWLFMV